MSKLLAADELTLANLLRSALQTRCDDNVGLNSHSNGVELLTEIVVDDIEKAISEVRLAADRVQAARDTSVREAYSGEQYSDEHFKDDCMNLAFAFLRITRNL